MHRTETSIAGYQVIASSGEWPELYASYRTNAQLVDISYLMEPIMATASVTGEVLERRTRR